MKRAIIKWWISRAIDQSHEVSGWLRSQIDRDVELQRFVRAARQMEHDLRADSSAWIADESLRVSADSLRDARQVNLSNRRTTIRGLAVVLTSLAAVLLIGVVLSRRARLDDRPQPRSTSSSVQLAEAVDQRNAPPDTEALVEVIDASQALVHPFVTTLPRRWRTSLLPKADIRATYQRLAGPTAEHVWEDVRSTIHTERQQVTSDLRSAFTFFSRRLPQSAARLLGLVPSAG